MILASIPSCMNMSFWIKWHTDNDDEWIYYGTAHTHTWRYCRLFVPAVSRHHPFERLFRLHLVVRAVRVRVEPRVRIGHDFTADLHHYTLKIHIYIDLSLFLFFIHIADGSFQSPYWLLLAFWPKILGGGGDLRMVLYFMNAGSVVGIP